MLINFSLLAAQHDSCQVLLFPGMETAYLPGTLTGNEDNFKARFVQGDPPPLSP